MDNLCRLYVSRGIEFLAWIGSMTAAIGNHTEEFTRKTFNHAPLIHLRAINSLTARLRRPNAVGRVLLIDGGSVSDPAISPPSPLDDTRLNETNNSGRTCCVRASQHIVEMGEVVHLPGLSCNISDGTELRSLG